MIRVLGPGLAPQLLRDAAGMSAGGALQKVGADPTGLEIAVNGRRSDADTRLNPGDTVSLQPRAFNG